MKLYCIKYIVLGTDTISPIVVEIQGCDEEDARWNFLESKKFYNTTDPERVVIISIRRIR